MAGPYDETMAENIVRTLNDSAAAYGRVPKRTEPSPGERFRWVIRAALECENAGLSEDEIARVALLIGRWLKWNAPDGAGSDWFASLAGEEEGL